MADQQRHLGSLIFATYCIMRQGFVYMEDWVDNNADGVEEADLVDNNADGVEEVELWSSEKSLIYFQGITFLFLLSSSDPFLSIIFHYPLLFSNLLIMLCYLMRQVLLCPLPSESEKEHSEGDAIKNQADHDGVIINNVHESDQSDDGFIVNDFCGGGDSESAKENGNATVDDEIGDHLKREMDYQLVPPHEDEDDDASSWEGLKSNLMAELEASNAAAAAKEEAKSEEDDAKCKREVKEAAVAPVEFRLQQSQEFAGQLLKCPSKCEEDKKSLNEKLRVSKAAYEEQRQKWEEERKVLVSKLNIATSLVDAFNEDRCKWEDKKAKLKSDMEELTSQNEENALSLMNLSAQLRAAKASKKDVRGMMHQSENMLELMQEIKELSAKLQDATLEAGHYYTLLHDSDERCRSWQEAYYSIYYNYYSNPPTNAL
ncbi:hypothetical protein FNV43_RR21805 [Rhamnella rubrinervis]|uniref:Uncharacterized protein n=1 Tax=Rhamnella rubrinervis TaxID=2594499 RepID=A0A8K0DP96_9ROSA|nr:hypothetical protein FNV43_RR21805 [Rhamnella rubrinervis]